MSLKCDLSVTISLDNIDRNPTFSLTLLPSKVRERNRASGKGVFVTIRLLNHLLIHTLYNDEGPLFYH